MEESTRPTSRNPLQPKFFCGHHTLQKISGLLLNYLIDIYIIWKSSEVSHSKSQFKNQVLYLSFCISAQLFSVLPQPCHLCSDMCHMGLKALPKPAAPRTFLPCQLHPCSASDPAQLPGATQTSLGPNSSWNTSS